MNVDERLAIFKKHYPIWKGHGAAKRAFYKLKPDDALLQRMLTAIDNQQKERVLLKKIGGFIPPWKHPSTWLNQECWEDDVILDEEQLREQYGRSARKGTELVSDEIWSTKIRADDTEFNPFD